MHVYISLLKQMAPEHLLATFAKLCAEILAAASDGMLNIQDVSGQSVLQDAFQILACKEIRISTNRASTSDAADMEEEGGNNAAAAARGRVITQAVKKGLIQNTIPIFIELKRLLESKNSPLIGSLMECLRVLLKDYKNEIDDMLVADKQLQKELIYDMQKYESEKAKSKVAEAVASIQKSQNFCSPGAPKSKVAEAVARIHKSGNFRSPVASKSKVAKAVVSIHKSGNFRSPGACRTGNGTGVQNKFTQKLQSDSKVASAMADAVAAATARSVLREVNQGALSPPLSAISVPKLKSIMEEPGSRGTRPLDVLESLRRRQSFDSDDEN